MAKKAGLFDLEAHFAFYGAYHSNPINILIHILFVWPIFFTGLMLFYFTPTIYDISRIGFGSHGLLVVNFGFLFTLIYALFYVCLDKKAGTLAALLCFACWVGASFVSSSIGYSLAWKLEAMQPLAVCQTQSRCFFAPYLNAVHNYRKFIATMELKSTNLVVLAAQLFCWTGQFLGHGVFEKRAPALLDNLTQALIMAPFFVFLEVLQTAFGYEPYSGFQASVKAKIDAEMKAWQDKKQKKST